MQKATQTCSEIPSSLSLLDFSSLLARKNFDFAQDDRLIVNFVVGIHVPKKQIGFPFLCECFL